MKKETLNKIIRYIREEIGAAPTNNIGGGKIAGSVEAGDDPPVRKKKKYIIALSIKYLELLMIYQIYLFQKKIY